MASDGRLALSLNCELKSRIGMSIQTCIYVSGSYQMSLYVYNVQSEEEDDEIKNSNKRN